MKHLKKFNEEKEGDIILTMDDVKLLKHNLGSHRNPSDFQSNYNWTDNQTLEASKSYSKRGIWNDKEIEILDLYTRDGKYKSELGYAIMIDGSIKYLIGIYEPHGCSLNEKRGLVTAHGHEEIIKLWLDDGEFEATHTR